MKRENTEDEFHAIGAGRRIFLACVEQVMRETRRFSDHGWHILKRVTGWIMVWDGIGVRIVFNDRTRW